MGITMDKWTIEGCTKATVQDRPHLARSGRTTARPGRILARLSRTTTGRTVAEAQGGPVGPGTTLEFLAKAQYHL
jgi:hypothetical protein